MNELMPTHPMRSPILLRSDLLASGLNDRAIARLVRSQTLHRIRHGSYVARDAWHSLDEAGRHGLRSRAVLARAGTDVALSHTSALPDWGAPIWGLDLDEVHLTRLDGKSGRREAGVRQHRGKVVAKDVVRRNGVLVTAPARLLIEIASLGEVEPALVVWNDVLHRGLTTLEDVGRRYRELVLDSSGSMEHWPGTLYVNVLLGLADPRLESVGESRTFHLCWKQHLPMPEPQLEIRDASGRVVARLDFAWPQHKVWLEFDGKVKYTQHLREGETVADAVLREKRREEMISELTGWRCIRITWADLMQPEKTAARIRRLLGIDLAAA